MDEKDDVGTPEWRPVSSLSEDVGSTPTSSSILSPPETQSDVISTEYHSVTATDGRHIEPFETTFCDGLTEALRTQKPLVGALRNVIEGVQFNAKWFAEPTLSAILEAATDTAALSSSSADLYGTLELIDAVVTYAFLPGNAVTSSVRFIAYAYYQGTRMHKYRRLAKAAWKSIQQLLDSHLSAQCLLALLTVLDDHIDTKTGAGAATGALKILAEKLLKKKHRSAFPGVPLLALLLSCRSALSKDNEILRQEVIDVLNTVLSAEHLLEELDLDAGWNVFLDCVRGCMLDVDKRVLDPLLDRLASIEPHLDQHQLSTLGGILIESDRPLSSTISAALLAPWSMVELLATTAHPPGFEILLRQLSRSSTNTTSLILLIESDIRTVVRNDQRRRFAEFIVRYCDPAISKATAPASAVVCTQAITRCFIRSLKQTTYDGSTEWKVASSFAALCGIAGRSAHVEARIAALQALLCVRADVAGAVYLTTFNENQLALPEEPSPRVSLSVTGTGQYSSSRVPKAAWEKLILDSMGDVDYEVYSFLLEQLPLQLTNHSLFADSAGFIKKLRAVACATVDLPSRQGTDKSHDTIRLIHLLTTLIGYRRMFSKSDLNEIVDAFLRTAGARDFLVSIHSVHALTVCCYELPDVVTSRLDSIIDKMSKMVTQRHVAIHVLEFLAGLSRLPNLYRNFRQGDFKRIFGVCLSYLQSIRDDAAQPERMQTPVSEQSSAKSAEAQEDLPQYVYALAHHVITFWYINLRPGDRPSIKRYIASSLRYTPLDGTETIEDHGLVIVDMMDRVDSGCSFELRQEGRFESQDGRLIVRNRLAGLLLISTQTSIRSGRTLVTVRRPSATTYSAVVGGTTRLPTPQSKATVTSEADESDTMTLMLSDPKGSTYGLVSIPAAGSLLGSPDIITLPEDDTVKRFVEGLDRVSGLDSHKAGVVYVGEGQTDETAILLNSSGSPDYREIVRGLGEIRTLKGATFNAQGLDRVGGTDGEHAIVWRNEVTELVFHVTTMMPEGYDAQATMIQKKMHIGNDHVNIVFNNSGSAFNFETFPGQFNFVYIVITPSARTTFLQTRMHTMNTNANERFYKVELFTKEGFPAISSAAEAKIISGTSLPAYVRNLALNACVFSLVWQSKDTGEYPSSWRLRLQMIQGLRRRYASLAEPRLDSG